MPLIKRIVEPVHVSNVGVHPGVRNELECVANNTLANTIRQLSSLSKHAEDLFTELFSEASSVYNRLNHLQSRMEDVHRKVKQLDATVEEDHFMKGILCEITSKYPDFDIRKFSRMSLQDIHLRKPYRSNIAPDQQVVSSSTMPNAMRITYHQCDRAPALEKLDRFREDGKDSIKFYTDSHFFVDFWYAEMQKDIEQKKTEIKARKKRRPKIQEARHIRPVKTKKDEYQKMALGVEFSDYQTPNIHGPVQGKGHHRRGQPHQGHPQQPYQQRPDSLEIASTPTGSMGIPEMLYDMTNPDVIPNGYASQMNGPYSMVNHTPGGENLTPEHSAGLPNRNNVQYMQGNQMSPSHAVGHHGRSTARAQNLNSARPSRPPPDPPSMPGTPKHDPIRNSPIVRESLPPPPLPPDQLDELSDSYPGSPDTTPKHVSSKTQNYTDINSGSPARSSDSPSRHPPYGNQNRTPDSVEFPLPPSPPSTHSSGTPVSLDSMPPPPSLTTTSLGSAGKVEDILKPATGQDRSALLEEIRLGEWYKKLRRVEDRKKQEQQKRQPQGGRFDVQAIMDRAIEIRRKVLEASDSEEEAFSDENEWDSD
uniref:Wiskott-Aldrich syndrome protein family member n=1 Tax=Octopus bimaculoides TaxID=37653 RepID=A0A0L8HKU2_OCTBM